MLNVAREQTIEYKQTRERNFATKTIVYNYYGRERENNKKNGRKKNTALKIIRLNSNVRKCQN